MVIYSNSCPPFYTDIKTTADLFVFSIINRSSGLSGQRIDVKDNSTRDKATLKVNPLITEQNQFQRWRVLMG